ncbi:twin-arginine translocase TatA/TatE family subunit [Saccharopolyspora sp. HNM0983]|uniref:Sec-independent protein translocase protein TatA n=1 Tax=Saccharopolyspora montiporae TaxID=2781240 RepID=A0A929BBD7_9PSEU|nr:twin-arginine translocase TatA/TatE family subunit [Saccharopolyspora sp. HNM0983]MBE9375250.1 twin-arginine translocase TatA/TatE family subunit [Saccharopolyspora sp. HNM0983]
MPGTWEILIVVLVLVAVFGASKLPKMARSLGQSARVLKAEARGLSQDEERAKSERSESADALPAGGGSATDRSGAAAEDETRDKQQN